MVQATYPGFSRGSILIQAMINNPIYQGMAPRKKPMINLQKKHTAPHNQYINK
jgi:hypothetical protein